MANVEERVELTCLLDIYGPLLTEHRREVLRLYCEEDFSLAEIAEQMRITRQGVGDALQKGRAQLTDWEAKLGIAGRYRALDAQAHGALRALDRVQARGEDLQHIDEARSALKNILYER